MIRALPSLCVLACAAIAFSPVASKAQDQPQPPISKQATPDSVAVLKIEPLHVVQSTPEWINAQINDWFKPAVDFAESILMRPIYWTEQKYVQLDHVVHYTRPADDAAGLFTIYGPDLAEKPANLPDTLSLQEALKWQARGNVATGNDSQPFSPGRLGEKGIEVVAIKINTSDKFVLQSLPNGEVVYKLAGKIRGQLSPEKDNWRTPDQIQEMASRHLLLLRSDAKPDDKDPPYLQTERVGGAPLVVVWLGCGALFFTLYFGFVNIWGFRHSLAVVSGIYDNPDEPGEVTHFQALASALSATVGLGNIAGVTIAMTMGGPGAFFWMMVCGFLGMASKFAECTLGQMYREVKPDGTILGGPMQYLLRGFEEFGFKSVGVVLSVVFAVLCIMASFGGGNMFQSNQSADAALQMVQSGQQVQVVALNEQIKAATVSENWDQVATLQQEKTELVKEMANFKNIFKIAFGIVFSILVALVIIGGIKRIAAVSSKIVPLMCVSYVLMCIYIIAVNYTKVPNLFISIFTEAFTPKAALGGIVGVAIIGIQRAAFSNEAGVGSAAIAHSAAKTDQPVREGLVALLGPFIDTIVVCSMTALVILITEAWNNESWVVTQNLKGAALTSKAFESQGGPLFKYTLSIAIMLFAYSTLISWSYYGERCWERLFGVQSIMAYRCIYVGVVFLGAVASLDSVIGFSDMMLLSMAFPNIVGVLLLSPKVKRHLHEYWGKYKAGEFKKFK